MQKFWHFLQYNNLVPVTLFVIFGGSGVALAATPQVQQAVYSEKEEVKGVDNTYLVSVDLSHYDFGLKIADIKEDEENYYISYAYKTITLVDYVWKQADVLKTLTLSKKEVEGHDLGLMIQKQLGEEVRAEMTYLTEAQEKERKAGVTMRTVTTTYAGLIGARLDPTTKKFPGYVPKVADTSLPPEIAGAVAAVAPGSQTTNIALPPIPTKGDIAKLVQDAVSNALNGNQNLAASSTQQAPPENNPPVASGPDGSTSPADVGSGSAAPPAEAVPPATTTPDAPPATTTPPEAAPPATTTPDTSASTTTPPASTAPPVDTPPVTAPSADTSGSSTPSVTVPQDEGSPAATSTSS